MFSLKALPTILRVGGILAVFALGWYSKSVLVENRELKELRAQLQASNTALIQFQNTVDSQSQQIEQVRRELDEENLESCTNTISLCVSRGLERLRQTR